MTSPSRPRAHARRPWRIAALLVALIGAGGAVAAPPSVASAAPSQSSGWTTNAAASPTSVKPGGTVTLAVSVMSSTKRSGIVDLEVFSGTKRVLQKAWDNQAFSAGASRTFSITWPVPANQPAGALAIKVGVFAPGWTSMQQWNNNAGTVMVTSSTTTPTPAPPVTTPPTTTAPPTTTPVTTPPTTAPPVTAPPATVPPTTAPPATVPPTTAPPVSATPVPAGSVDYLLDFNGPTALDTIRRGVYHRNIAIGYPAGHEYNKTWPADHDMTCGAPTTSRTLDGTHDENDVFACKDHVMTSMGDVDGYSLTWFSPKQTFTNTSKVCWDVNLTDLGTRTWWEVAVVPVATSELIADDWLVELSPGVPGPAGPITPYSKANGVIAAWGPFDHKLAINDDRDSVDYTAGTDKATRYHHCLTDNGNGTVTFTQARGDGTVRSFTSKRSFPKGEAKIVFKQHSYTPDKDGPVNGYTFHWDNVEVVGTPTAKSGAMLRSTLLTAESRDVDTSVGSGTLLCQIK